MRLCPWSHAPSSAWEQCSMFIQNVLILNMLHQIRHCTASGPQQQICPVWSRSDEQFSRCVRNKQSDKTDRHSCIIIWCSALFLIRVIPMQLFANVSINQPWSENLSRKDWSTCFLTLKLMRHPNPQQRLLTSARPCSHDSYYVSLRRPGQMTCAGPLTGCSETVNL